MLPPEVIRQIIMEVRGLPLPSSDPTWPHDSPWRVEDPETYPTLYNLALTSRAFNTLTTPILYGYLDFSTTSESYDLFIRILVQNPPLGKRVRGLQIANRESVSLEWDWDPDVCVEELYKILGLVPNVEQLCLKSVFGFDTTGQPREEVGESWHDIFVALMKLSKLKVLHLSIGEAKMRLPSLPTLETLILDDFSLPIIKKAKFPSLCTLETRRYVPKNYETTFPSTLLPQLHELRLSGGDNLDRHFHSINSSLVTILKTTINLKVLRINLIDKVEGSERFSKFVASPDSEALKPLDLLEAHIFLREDSKDDTSLSKMLKVLLLKARSPKLLRITFEVPVHGRSWMGGRGHPLEENSDDEDVKEKLQLMEYARSLRNQVRSEWSQDGSHIVVKVRKGLPIGLPEEEFDEPNWDMFRD